MNNNGVSRTPMMFVAGVFVLILATFLPGCMEGSHGFSRNSRDQQEPVPLMIHVEYGGEKFGPYIAGLNEPPCPPADALPRTYDVVDEFSGWYDILARAEKGSCLDGQYQLLLELKRSNSIPFFECSCVTMLDDDVKVYAAGGYLVLRADAKAIDINLIVHSGHETHILNGTVNGNGTINGKTELRRRSKLIGSGVFMGTKAVAPETVAPTPKLDTTYQADQYPEGYGDDGPGDNYESPASLEEKAKIPSGLTFEFRNEMFANREMPQALCNIYNKSGGVILGGTRVRVELGEFLNAPVEGFRPGGMTPDYLLGARGAACRPAIEKAQKQMLTEGLVVPRLLPTNSTGFIQLLEVDKAAPVNATTPIPIIFWAKGPEGTAWQQVGVANVWH